MTAALCYFCQRPVVLTPLQGLRCPQCDVVLVPAPAWVKEAGWPEQAVPSCQRSRAKHHALTPIKRIRFHGNENRLLARRLEFLAQVRRCKINDLLLHYVRLGFDHEHREDDAP